MKFFKIARLYYHRGYDERKWVILVARKRYRIEPKYIESTKRWATCIAASTIFWGIYGYGETDWMTREEFESYARDLIVWSELSDRAKEKRLRRLEEILNVEPVKLKITHSRRGARKPKIKGGLLPVIPEKVWRGIRNRAENVWEYDDYLVAEFKNRVFISKASGEEALHYISYDKCWEPKPGEEIDLQDCELELKELAGMLSFVSSNTEIPADLAEKAKTVLTTVMLNRL